MKKEKIELFVPGRLCLFGEHSDWAGRYRNVNNKISKGLAIVTGIEEGIYANVIPSEKFIVRYANGSESPLEMDMDYKKLLDLAESDNYWSYAAGVAAAIKEHYNVKGLEIEITNVTLPIKKGLSSSAAICVLITRAFNQIYGLHLNTIGEMDYAYRGETMTPSRCGKLDQACAFGKKPILMTFNGDNIKVDNIKVGDNLDFVFADLMAKKDTIKILGDLNRCYPFAQNDIESNVQLGLGEKNIELVSEAVNAISDGDKVRLGELMTLAQSNFDKYVAPACPDELSSPILHSVLNDEYIKSLSYGGKGVGSQGDGTIQFLAKDSLSAEKIIDYINNKLNMQAYSLRINKSKPIKKAIIPVAGNGTRMYPITKLLKKAFLPIIDEDGILKPAIMCLLEELYDAGIEQICLIIDENDLESYEKFFNENLSNEVTKKLSSDQLEYENKILKIGKCLSYVIQKEKLGLGHAVSLCKDFVGNDNVLLVLGDQLYKTDAKTSCTNQLLNCFEKNEMLTISVNEVDIADVSKYGILCGTKEINQNGFMVDKMYEKPESSYASEYLYTMDSGIKKYYSVFGEYILTPSVFKELDRNIKNGLKENGEFQLTSALDSVREKEGMYAFIPDGEMLDIGNVNAYTNTLIKKMEK